MKKMLVALGIAMLIAVPSGAAIAAGSDSPTPYTVTVEGIQLPAGETFKDGGHVNIKTNQGDRGIHFEALNNQPSGKWIGLSFLPWSAFGLPDESKVCVQWVQLSQFNEHYGEGGQPPIGPGCVTASPSPSPTSSASPSPTATPTPSSTSTPSSTPTPVATPTTTPSATSSPEPTPSSSLLSSSVNKLAATGASPEDVGIQGMLVGGALLFLIGLVLVANAYKR